MERKGKLSLILMFFGILVTVSLLESTQTFSFAFADTNLEFAVAECPVLSNGGDEESGQCPDIKTIENEGERIGNEQSDTSTNGDHIVDEQSDTVDEQSETSPPVTSGPVNPFGP